MAVLFSFIVLLLPRAGEGGPWKGWKILLVSSGADRAGLGTFLKSRDYYPLLNPHTALVDVADYSGSLASMSLEAVESRILPGDPRLDDYVRGLPGFFKGTIDGEGVELWYYKKGIGSYFDFTRSGDRSIIAGVSLLAAREGSPAQVWEYLGGILALLGVALQVPGRRRRILRLLLLAPWLLVAQRGAFWAFALVGAAAMPLTIAASACVVTPLLAAGNRESKGRWATISAILVFALPLWAGILIRPELIPDICLALLSSCLIIAAYSTISGIMEAGARKKFIAVPIASAVRRWARDMSGLSLGSAIIFISLALLPSVLLSFGPVGLPALFDAKIQQTGRIVLPMPYVPSSQVKGPETERLTNLPNLEDYARHLDFQRGFFSRRLGSPYPSGLQNGKSASEMSVHKAIRPISIEAMLRDQGRASAIRNEVYEGRSMPPLAPLAAILYILPVAMGILARIGRNQGHPKPRHRRTKA